MSIRAYYGYAAILSGLVFRGWAHVAILNCANSWILLRYMWTLFCSFNIDPFEIDCMPNVKFLNAQIFELVIWQSKSFDLHENELLQLSLCYSQLTFKDPFTNGHDNRKVYIYVAHNYHKYIDFEGINSIAETLR